jgi:Tol biopolymer transport system component
MSYFDEPQRLTHDGKLKLAPVFIASGTEIVFAVHESPNLVALKRLKLSDGSEERLHPEVAAHQFDAAFSPDGRFHAYAMSATSPQLVLVIQDTAEKKQSIFRPQDARATARYPTIAPDGSRVVFSLSDVGGQQIASVNVQGQDLKRLTQSTGMNSWPAFSPDGRQIAFGSSRDGELDLFIMDADGNDVRRLSSGPGRDMHPAWSPDGKRIAFTSTRDGDYEIYVMNADGSGQRNLTNHPGRDDFPAWHPDGRRILFVSDRDGRSDLYLVDASSAG